jgi:hypothetical protein
MDVPISFGKFFRDIKKLKRFGRSIRTSDIDLVHTIKMVRKLKHHEQKLLRKVDFTTYASDNNHRDAAVIRRYAIQKPSDYQKYNRICGVSHPFSTHYPHNSAPPDHVICSKIT